MSTGTIVAGVAGWPVAHSLSPRLHGFWLREHGIDGAYVPLAIAPYAFSSAVAGLRQAGFVGVNVTNPHKEAAFAIAATLDAPARATGAVNLLVFRDGHMEGRNTDGVGLAASLTETLGPEALIDKDVAVLGAGGAARGVVLALDRLGAREIRLVARDKGRLDALVASFRGVIAARLVAFGWSAWPRAAGGAVLLVNATTGGMTGTPALDLALDPLPGTAAVCDIVYNPVETKLLKDAHARGHRTIDGLGMLMHQAVPAFAAFYGVTPKVTLDLRAELEKALHHG
jgi:shikimate dehydrogenase